MVQNSQDKTVKATPDALVHAMFPVIAGVLGLVFALLFKMSVLDIQDNRTLPAFGLGAGVVFVVLSAVWVIRRPEKDISDLPPPPADLEIVSAWQFSRLYLVHYLKVLPYAVVALAFGGALVAGALFALGIMLLLEIAMLARKAHKMHVVVLTTPVRKRRDEPKLYAMSTSRMSPQSSGDSV